MRRLLNCLAKGGEAFFKEKVKKGRFFRQTVCDANLIHLDEHIVAKYQQVKRFCKEADLGEKQANQVSSFGPG